MRTRNLRRAFSLMELLVVMAILAVMMALFFPALATAKARAQRIQCISNERELNQVWTLYAQDNNDDLAANGQCVPGGDPNSKLWVQGSYFYPDINSALLYSPQYALFAPYLESSRVYHCPSDVWYITVQGAQYPKLRSYGLNAFMGWRGQWVNLLCLPDTYRIFLKDSQINTPSRFFTFQDEYPKSICWPYFGVHMGPAGTEAIYNYPAIAHDGGGDIGFADGHVAWHRWLDPRTVSPVPQNFHQHNESSPRNQDVDWLREHTTLANRTGLMPP